MNLPKIEVWGSKSRYLQGVEIIFGITGSVAAYRAVDVMRELIKRGATVNPVMSKDAMRFVTAELLQWATGKQVFSEFGGVSRHIELGDSSDVMVIAPATANTITKIAHGISDNPVTLTALYILGLGKPLLIVPSMHRGLWEAPQVRESVTKLKELGADFLPPIMEGGKAKFPHSNDIAAAAGTLALRKKDLVGKKLLITAGPTREWLDPVRFISNPSSGLMGIELARNAYFRGAEVTLIHGPTTEIIPHYVESLRVETVEEMLHASIDKIKKSRYDAVILSAAPSDFRFRETFKEKIPSSLKPPELVPTPKISVQLRNYFNGLMVGFAAETAESLPELVEKAKRKLKERGFDLIVANNVENKNAPFGSLYNEVVIIRKDGKVKYVRKDLKAFIAMKVLDEVAEELMK